MSKTTNHKKVEASISTSPTSVSKMENSTKRFSGKSKQNNPDYLYSMSHAARIDEDSHIGQILPIIVFSSIVILVVRMYTYNRNMSQFFWTNQTNTTNIVDFFSYYKMIAITICAIIALIILLYRITTQSLAIKRSFAYIPMATYILFVILSYVFSDYKEFAWLGWNDRFEGTLSLLGYMVLLFFIINSIKTEKNVKMIIYPLAISSFILSIIGITQAIDHDFFRTAIGQKLIVPNSMLESGITAWQGIDAAMAKGEQYLAFHFQNKQVYQTVYNINYVSFYLTLLIPLFGMIFIRSMNKDSKVKLWEKMSLGILFALLLYNFIGAKSSGGFLGLGVMGLTGIILLNKRLLQWIKPLGILFTIASIVLSVTSAIWLPELQKAANSVLNKETILQEIEGENLKVKPGSIKATIDYFVTGKDTLQMSFNGTPLTLTIARNADGAISRLIASDDEGNKLPLLLMPDISATYSIEDARFRDYLTLNFSSSKDNVYLSLNTAGEVWRFLLDKEQILYHAKTNRTTPLYKVPSLGFSDNLQFGSNRGYIWSRTFPMLRNSIFWGTGADTYCIVFPQEDYVGKYNAEFKKSTIIVDKPHNMYLGAAVGTGCASLLSLLVLYGIYLIQSAKLYWKKEYNNDYITFVGAGIFLGVAGFLTTGLVDDSTVSVMPMFYTLLGMGIAINQIIKNRVTE